MSGKRLGLSFLDHVCFLFVFIVYVFGFSFSL
jgi:hypothetical protein